LCGISVTTLREKSKPSRCAVYIAGLDGGDGGEEPEFSTSQLGTEFIYYIETTT